MCPFLYFTFDTCFLVMTFTVLSNFNMKNCMKIQNALIYCYIYQYPLPGHLSLILIKMYSKLNLKLNNWSWKIRDFFFHRRTDGCKLICKDILLLTKKTQKIKVANVKFVLCISFYGEIQDCFVPPISKEFRLDDLPF